ncbi:AMP-binding protein [Rhizobium sp. Leaf386]|uniref:class I adenylate-forming enzyme family protein n=1 Tax=Rhizobium sp. Leaf386 TaxID=1736359 RepID=UPI000714B081|nr:AMP-binding protein [Rhizobium sp. Leaf386]KQS95475.1 long-chain fatty acid--CoA ligase [Rhizobium sp. Leaf386]
MLEPLEVLELYPPHDDTLKGLFDSRASVGPYRPLLGFGEQQYSWQSFLEAVERTAAMLYRQGVGKRDRVAIVATNSDVHVILLFALARLGAAMVPLNPNFGISELAYILNHAAVSGVMVTEATLPTVKTALQQGDLKPWVLNVDLAADLDPVVVGAPEKEFQAPIGGEPDDTCLIIYTSGTTGLPKGVMHSQRNYVTCAEIASGRTAVQPNDKVLIILPFFHVNALFYSLGSIFAAGASGVILPRFSASNFWDSVVQTQATHVNIIEAVGNILQKRPREEFRSDHRLRVVYGVRAAFVKTFHDEFHIPTLVTGFGMTECPGVLCNPLKGPEKPGSVGVLGSHPDTSRPSTQARVVDDDGNDVPNGEVGELWLDSPMLMQGYFRDEEHTTAAYREGWFTTGDLVRRDDDGYFYFVSRKKDIIRRRGENISGAELDRVIGEHPAVYEAAAIAVPAELGEDEILAVVVLKTDVELTEQDIADWCRAHLAPMKVPRYILFLDELPHTATHKVAKAQLRADPSLREKATDLEQH